MTSHAAGADGCDSIIPFKPRAMYGTTMGAYRHKKRNPPPIPPISHNEIGPVHDEYVAMQVNSGS